MSNDKLLFYKVKKLLLYVIISCLLSILILPVNVIAAPGDDEGTGMMSDSTIMAITIGAGLLMGIFMIFKMKKGNKDEFSKIDSMTSNYDTASTNAYNDTSSAESRMSSKIGNINEYANSLSPSISTSSGYSASADIPMFDSETGRTELKRVSGLENVEKTIASAKAKTRKEQLSILNQLRDAVEDISELETDALSSYIPADKMPPGFDKMTGYERYTERMRELAKKIMIKAEEISSYIKAIDIYNSEAGKLLKTEYDFIIERVKNHDTIISNTVKSIDTQYEDIQKELININKTFYYKEKDKYIKDANTNIVQLQDSYNDSTLNDMVSKLKNNANNIDVHNSEIHKLATEFAFETSIKTGHFRDLWGVFSQVNIPTTKDKIYIDPDNIQYDINLIDRTIDRIHNLIKLEEYNSQHINKINSRIIILTNQAKKAANDFINHFDKLRNDELKSIKDQEQLIFDEAKYVEELVANPKLADVTLKEGELLSRISAVKTRKYDSETKAIIDLLHSQVLDRLQAEKAGLISEKVAYDNIKDATRKIVNNLKFFKN